MAVTGTKTAGDAVNEALWAAGIAAIDETPSTADVDQGIRTLNRMLKGWQARESFDWTLTYLSHSMTATAAQTLSPVRPVRVRHVNFRQNGIDRQLTEMTRAEYDMLPNKSAAGEPTSWYYDRQRENAVLYVWPVPSSVSGKTLEITYEREMEDIAASSDALDVPGDAWEAVVTCLGDILADEYRTGIPSLKERAQRSYAELLAGQNEGSVWFGEPT